MAVITESEGGPRIWAGMPLERALAWTGVLIRRRPVWPGAGAMWMVSQAYRRGLPAGIREWAHRARVAEAMGLDPERYEALHASLDRVPRTESAAHPDNDLDLRHAVPPTRPFDAALWSPWSALLDAGRQPDEATRLLLAARDAKRRVTDV